MIEMPPAIRKAWHTQGYYGSANHNIKGIYQRYLGWYDGNPAHLWQHPPEVAGTRYVEAIGGIKVKEYFDKDDLRFAAELSSHAVFADRDSTAARNLLALVLERLGYESEAATWRNCYLQGAHELRTNKVGHTDTNSDGMAPALTTTQLFDSLGIRVNGPKAWSHKLSINWHLTDEKQRYRMELSNGALIHYPTKAKQDADVTVTLIRPQLLNFVMNGESDGLEMDGVF
jgi:alkyl sulfatase BDS1-like metallo-beta-lactamase superfamily hydrolase